MDCPIARRVRRYLGFLVAAIALVPVSAGSQQSRAQSRCARLFRLPRKASRLGNEFPPSQRVGTAALKGRVVDGVTGDPVPRARCG